MRKISLSEGDLGGLRDLFNENYLILKQVKEYERKSNDIEVRTILKGIRNMHEDNLIFIMKLLDEKERII